MLNLKEILDEQLSEAESLCESRTHTRIPHIFNDESLTFGDIREMFKQIFCGKSRLVEKIDGLNVFITYKDGEFRIARNKGDLKDPMNYGRIGAQYDGCQRLRDAFINTVTDLGKALASLPTNTLESVFANGRNYLNVDIIYPPARNVMDYGNKCILQLNSVDAYDDRFNQIASDETVTSDLFEALKSHNAIKQEMFEISKPNVLRIRDSVDAENALQYLNADLDELVDGIGYKATIQDYANARLRKYIVNCAMKHGIDVGVDSDFVNEMADRISYISHRRPTKTDLVCYAKKEGINPRSEEYANLFNFLHNTSDQINEQIMIPIETLILKASNLLFKNLVGFMAADPNKNAQRIVCELEDTIRMLESDDNRLTGDKLRRFRKHVKKLQQYGDNGVFPTEGVIFKYTTRDGKSKAYKLIGNFGAINQIMNLIRS